MRLDLRALYGQGCADLVLLPPGAEFDLRDGCNGCQRFATEAHGVQIEKISRLPYLRRGMTLKCHAGIGHRHPFAIVYHLDAGLARIGDDHIDGRGTSVDGVLDKLLDDGRGALDDFAGRYLVGNRIRQKPNHITHKLKCF